MIRIVDFCSVEFFTLLFRLAVVFAIFAFIWGFINLAIGLLRGSQPKSYPLKSALKAIQFFLIADVSVLFVLKLPNWGTETIVVAVVILLAYFIGKINSMQMRFAVQLNGLNMPKQTEKPNYALEWGIIVFALGIFVFLIYNPTLAENKLSTWFYETILGIEKAPFFGFIFKIIGFVIGLTIFLRLINTIGMIATGKNPFGNPFYNGKNKNDINSPKDDTHFDDYQEVND